MHSYLGILVHLMILMSLLMVLSVPLMAIYASYNDLEHYTEYGWNRYSLGNMGGANALCVNSGFDSQSTKPVALMCTTGIISLDIKTEKTGEEMFDAGIIPSSAEVLNYCMSSAFEDSTNCSN